MVPIKVISLKVFWNSKLESVAWNLQYIKNFKIIMYRINLNHSKKEIFIFNGQTQLRLVTHVKLYASMQKRTTARMQIWQMVFVVKQGKIVWNKNGVHTIIQKLLNNINTLLAPMKLCVEPNFFSLIIKEMF